MKFAEPAGTDRRQQARLPAERHALVCHRRQGAARGARAGAARPGERPASRRCCRRAQDKLQDVEEAGPGLLQPGGPLPALHLGQPLRLSLRQHALHLPGAPRRGRRTAGLGPGGHRLAALLPRGPHAGLGKVGVPDAGRGARAPHRHSRPPRPAAAFRRDGPGAPPPGGLPHGGRGTRGALHLRRGGALGSAGWQLSRPGRRRSGLTRASGQREPARVGLRLFWHPEGGRHGGARRCRARPRPRSSTSPAGPRPRPSSCPRRRRATWPGCGRPSGMPGCRRTSSPWPRRMEGDDTAPDRIAALGRSTSPDDVASLIFTCGTTGQPKGVMLTHRNFASLVPKLAGSFDLGVGDGLLSVLPLHHTFEFSAGLLMPLRRGAEITYLDELTADRLGDVLETGRITAMVGVPALWSAAAPQNHPGACRQAGPGRAGAAGTDERARRAARTAATSTWASSSSGPSTAASAAASSSWCPAARPCRDEVHQAFHALGFDLTEGYGLTEAAPVLTVTAAGNKRVPGTAWARACPASSCASTSRTATAWARCWARGPNVMVGYFGDRRRHRGRPGRTAGCAPATWASSTTKGNLTLLGRARRTSSSTPAGRTSTRTSWRSSTEAHPAREGAVHRRAAGRGRRRGEGGLSLRRRTPRTGRARKCGPSSRNTSATSPPTCPSTGG